MHMAIQAIAEDKKTRKIYLRVTKPDSGKSALTAQTD